MRFKIAITGEVADPKMLAALGQLLLDAVLDNGASVTFAEVAAVPGDGRGDDRQTLIDLPELKNANGDTIRPALKAGDTLPSRDPLAGTVL